MSNRTHWKWRIALAALAGLLVAAVALSQVQASIYYIGRTQSFSVRQLKSIDGTINAFRARYHRLPKSLAELSKASGESDYYVDNTDGWGRAFAYTVRGEQYTLTSYGADGRPGGVGLDRDLTPATARNSLPDATFLQLLFDPLSENIRFSALVCGFLTFGLTLWVLRTRDFVGNGIGNLIVKLVVTLFAASFVALILATLDVPSGH